MLLLSLFDVDHSHGSKSSAIVGTVFGRPFTSLYTSYLTPITIEFDISTEPIGI